MTETVEVKYKIGTEVYKTGGCCDNKSIEEFKVGDFRYGSLFGKTKKENICFIERYCNGCEIADCGWVSEDSLYASEEAALTALKEQS